MYVPLFVQLGFSFACLWIAPAAVGPLFDWGRRWGPATENCGLKVINSTSTHSDMRREYFIGSVYREPTLQLQYLRDHPEIPR